MIVKADQGDTLHTSQGAEIVEWQVSWDRLCLATMDMKRQVSGTLFFWLPEPPKEVRLNGEGVSFSPGGNNTIAIPVQFTDQAKIEIVSH